MPFMADSVAAQQVQDCLKTVYALVHDIEQKRQASEQGMSAIAKLQAGDGEKGRSYSSEMKGLYKTAIAQAEQEEDVLRRALQKIAEIRSIKNERRIQARHSGNKETRRGACMRMLLSCAQTLPLFVGNKVGERPPPLCGAIPAESNYLAKAGDMVAALAKVGDEDSGNWILAEVVGFNHNLNKYEIDDILVEQHEKKRHTLSKKHVVALPLMRANPETDSHALFPQGTLVMALYPQTTCFYRAVVIKLPQTHVDKYEVLFEDATYKNGYSPPMYVAQRYVIALRQSGPKQA